MINAAIVAVTARIKTQTPILMPAFAPVLREDWCGWAAFEFVGLVDIKLGKLDDVVLELVGLEVEDEELEIGRAHV